MKVGILGGTFDPPHIGHLAIAKAAIEALGLDEVLFVPTSRNPLKRNAKSASPKQRLAMVQALIEDQDKMAACDVEIVRGGLSYAVETMTELSVAQPAEYWFLVGTDAAAQLEEWKQPNRLVRLCRLGVVVRTPVDEAALLRRIPREFHEFIDMIPMQPIDVSATDIRDRIAAGKPLMKLVPAPVLAYIKQNHLYHA